MLYVRHNSSLNQFLTSTTKIIKTLKTFSYGKIQVGGIAYTTYINPVFIFIRLYKQATIFVSNVKLFFTDNHHSLWTWSSSHFSCQQFSRAMGITLRHYNTRSRASNLRKANASVRSASNLRKLLPSDDFLWESNNPWKNSAKEKVRGSAGFIRPIIE